MILPLRTVLVSVLRLRVCRRVEVGSGGLRDGSRSVGMRGDNGRIIDGRIIFLEKKSEKMLSRGKIAPTTACGETPQLRWVDHWLEFFGLFVTFFFYPFFFLLGADWGIWGLGFHFLLMILP